MGASKFPELEQNRWVLAWDSFVHAFLQLIHLESKPFTSDEVFTEMPEPTKK